MAKSQKLGVTLGHHNHHYQHYGYCHHHRHHNYHNDEEDCCSYMATMVTPSQPCPSNAHNPPIFLLMMRMIRVVFMMIMAMLVIMLIMIVMMNGHRRATNQPAQMIIILAKVTNFPQPKVALTVSKARVWDHFLLAIYIWHTPQKTELAFMWLFGQLSWPSGIAWQM